MLRLKHGHHTTPSATSSTNAASSTKHSGFSQPLNRTDRGSAIALGILLILILFAVGWYCSMRIKQKKERDIEQRFSRQTGLTNVCGRSVGDRDLSFWEDKLFFVGMPSRPRADLKTTLVGDWSARLFNNRDQKRECSWPGTSPQSQLRSSKQSTYNVSGTLQASEDHRRSISRISPLSPLSLPPSPLGAPSFDPSVQRLVCYHRRQSSICSVDTYTPTRRASLPRTQYDKQWWSEVASHGGSTVRADRRLSTLVPILESEAALQVDLVEHIHCCDVTDAPAYL
jgi:hypothetical protein